MTRKIVLVWNRSKAPTKSAPLSLDTAGCQPMPNCILICLGMSDKSKLYPNWPNRNWLKFNPTWKLKRILDLLESRAKVHPIHCFLLCLAGKEVLGAYQTSKVCNSSIWYLSFFLHELNFWRIKFTPKCVNYDKIHRKLPIFCVITAKYTVNWQFFALNL